MTSEAAARADEFGNDEFRHWRIASAHPEWIGTDRLPLYLNEPQPGFYRILVKDRDGGARYYQRVAFFLHDGKVLAEREGKPVDPRAVSDLWVWAARRPISWELFAQNAETGEWPDDTPDAPGIGDNIAEADPLDALTIEFLGEKEMAEAFLAAPIADKDAADRAANWAKKLIAIGKRADGLHRDEKAPVIAEGDRIDERWSTLRTAPNALARQLKQHADDWFKEQDRLEKIRVEAAKREAERKRAEAAEAARAAEQARIAAEHEARRLIDEAKLKDEAEAKRIAREAEAIRRKADEQMADAGKLVSEAQAAEQDAKYRKPQAGRTGSKMSQRKVSVGRIVDYDAFIVAAKDHAEIKEAADKLCGRLARAGIALAGMTIEIEQRIV